MNKIKYGIIGVGNQGSYYAKMFADGKIENGVLTALCDNNENKLKTAKEKYGRGYEYFSDYSEMLKSGLIDVAMVETPHYQHPQIVMDCIENGINVICDKPAGVYTKQVKEMNAYAEKHNVKFGMMFNQRTNCVYRKMREIIAAGDIGSIQRVTWIITDWFRTQSYYDNGSWRATWKGEGGGVLINQCPHQIDLIQWIVGEMPVKVRAVCHYGKWHNVEVEDDVTAYFEYKNGATGVFITTTGEAPGTNRFEVSGSKGKLLCEGGKLIWFKNDRDCIEVCKTSDKGFDTPACEQVVVETDGKNLQHAGIINNFTNSLLGIEKQFVQGVDGINGVELMNAIELSGWNNGEEIALPIDEDRYLSELNEHIAISKTKKIVKDVVADTANTFGSK